MIPKLMDEEEIEIPSWFELIPQDEGEVSMIVDVEVPPTLNN